MLPSSRSTRSAPRIVQRLRHALNPPTHPPPVGIAAARQLSQAAPGTSGDAGASPPAAPPSTGRLVTYALAGGAAVAGAAYVASDPAGARDTVDKAVDEVDKRIRFFAEPSREKLLPDAAAPYPGAPPPRTLVIDLDQTLVYSKYSRATGWRVAKRPGAEAFLAYLAGFYEIVVFTSSLNSYADPILDRLDPNGYVAHRLYRAETHYRKGVHVKNLDHLNRDLERVVVVDCDAKHVSMHAENAVMVPRWTGEPGDTALLDLIPFLESLAKRDVADVREELKLLGEGEVATRVAEYRAVVQAQEEAAAAAGGGASLFGHSAPREAASGPQQQPQPAETEGGGGKGAVWGSLSGTGKIFHERASGSS